MTRDQVSQSVMFVLSAEDLVCREKLGTELARNHWRVCWVSFFLQFDDLCLEVQQLLVVPATSMHKASESMQAGP